MIKPHASWAASLHLFLLRRHPKSSTDPSPPLNHRLCLVPICKRRMSTQAQPMFAPLPTVQSESDAGAAGYQFRLVSYNILAQVYVKSAIFPHSPSACLKWKARSKAVLTALKNFDADLLCLQELDEYDAFYRKNMENSGYSSIYMQRSGDKRDGCGIFYKPKCVELVQKEGIHYNDLVEKYVPSDHVNSVPSNNSSSTEESNVGEDNKRGDPNDPRVRLKRDCVGLLAAFKLNDPCDHILIVANTHIYWDPELIDVKLAQAKYLLSRVSQFEKHISNKYNCKPSVIIAGDFNSTPGDKVYNFLISTNSEYSDEAPPIKFHSLYAANGGEPDFTNYTPDFTGTLDYIFLSKGSSIKPTTLLCLPSGNSADVAGGLPNFHHPSDHLPIGADFQVLGS